MKTALFGQRGIQNYLRFNNMRSTYKGCGSCILFILTTCIVYKISLPFFLEALDPEGNIPSDSRLEPKWRRAYGGHHVICHHYTGGIGDQLFQYASLLSIALSQDRILISKYGDCSLENFLIDVKVRPGASHCAGIETIKEKFCCREDDRFINLEPNKNYDFDGYFKSWSYFKHKEDYIKSNIQFQKPVLVKAKDAIGDALKSRNVPLTTILVGIHVQRGYFTEAKQVEDGHRVAPKEYFSKAIDYFRQRMETPVFIVMSEDIAWCAKNIPQTADVIHLPYQKAEVAMAIFTLVQHAVISVGSFSWWAGYLTKGEVIYYKSAIEPDSKMMTEYGGTTDNAYKPSWIAMD